MALLLFAGIAVFVGGLVIYNTFAILIAQRQIEMALLRCVGATRAQVFRSVLLEALIVGLLSSAVGAAAGAGLGAGGFAVLSAVVGVALGVVFGALAGRTIMEGTLFALPVGEIAVFLVCASLVGLLARVLPARRAARTSITESLTDQ